MHILGMERVFSRIAYILDRRQHWRLADTNREDVRTGTTNAFVLVQPVVIERQHKKSHSELQGCSSKADFTGKEYPDEQRKGRDVL